MLRRNQLFHLPDGRKLGCNEYGALGGRPILYFHGTASTRVDLRMTPDPFDDARYWVE
jgi:hypothetical protein